MSKRRKTRKKTQPRNQNNQQKSQPRKVVDTQTTVENLQNNLVEVGDRNKITDKEVGEIVEIKEQKAEQVNVKSVQEIYHKALSIEKVLEKRKNEYERLKEKLESEKVSLETEKKGAEKLKKDLALQLDKYNNELTEINQLRVNGGWSSVIDKKVLDHYEEKLKEQESLLLAKITELSKRHSEYTTALTEIEASKIEIEKEYNEKIRAEKTRLKTVFEEKFNTKEKELEVLEGKLEKENRLILKKQKELKFEIEDFNDDKKFLTDKARKKVAQEIEDLKEQIKNHKQKNKALISELQKLKDELRSLGEYKAKNVISELRSKEKEIFDLREKLETSPDILKIDELKRLQKEKNEWQNKIRDVDAQLSEYKTRYENQKLQIGEKGRLVFEKEQLEQRIKLQQAALEELKEEVHELTRQTEDKITFVSCTEMDNKYKSSSNNIVQNEITEGWIKGIQQGIAQITENKLYYDENTLRAFISGLAMSRFSILQGISGTGKTSLPKAFAKAVGGYAGIVEVQSGWKDRQDLIGYYNTFEKKYYEGKFLKLLYMAGTPEYRDKPFFIILDEMNLSHPEHYFADLLSIMEETNAEKQILTISDKVKDSPKLMFDLEEGGIGLKIPQNVWFIGTANHDETTLQFAPKTYDRANVLEMPINIERFNIESIDFSKITVSNNKLTGFIKSRRWKSTNKSLKYLDGNFKSICKKFGIGWGNRLQKQIKLFVPVFEALGGDEANALDHIIATKILRSIKGRYDLQETTLVEMKEELEKNFKKAFKVEARKSLKIVNSELSRLE